MILPISFHLLLYYPLPNLFGLTYLLYTSISSTYKWQYQEIPIYSILAYLQLWNDSFKETKKTVSLFNQFIIFLAFTFTVNKCTTSSGKDDGSTCKRNVRCEYLDNITLTFFWWRWCSNAREDDQVLPVLLSGADEQVSSRDADFLIKSWRCRFYLLA